MSVSAEKLQHLIHSAKSKDPRIVIKDIREDAEQEYIKVKTAKREELRRRNHSVSLSIDRKCQKIQNKRIDNHASAVATRKRRDFTFHRYEVVINNTMAENFQLADACTNLTTLVTEKDEELRRKDELIQLLTDKLSSVEGSNNRLPGAFQLIDDLTNIPSETDVFYPLHSDDTTFPYFTGSTSPNLYDESKLENATTLQPYDSGPLRFQLQSDQDDSLRFFNPAA